MSRWITPDDLAPFASIDDDRAEAMCQDAEATALLAAPCIDDDTFTQTAALKAILRAAILRWHDSGTGAITTQTAGPFGQTIDTSQPRRAMFWPSEIDSLRNLCQRRGSGDAYTVDMRPIRNRWWPLNDNAVINVR